MRVFEIRRDRLRAIIWFLVGHHAHVDSIRAAALFTD